MKILSFTSSDKLQEIDIEKNNNNILESLLKINDRNIKLIYHWSHDNGILECYGCDKNLYKEKINTHNLPPSNLSYTLYGDIYLVYKINDSIIDLDISHYGMMTYYIEERYENLDIQEKFDEIISDEEMDENENIIDEIIELPKKKIKKNTNDKILDELDYDNTNY
jgi:hypothetical protein